MSLLIGFSGRARHGKTICCEAIQRAAQDDGKDARIYDIGNIIRLYCIRHGLLPQVERKDMTRPQLQVLIDVGKEKREIDPDFWVKQMMQAILFDAADVALCPNARFETEANAIKSHKHGYLVRVTRLNQNGSLFISEDRPPNDISETALEFWPCDYYLTAKEGSDALLAQWAVTLYKYLAAKEA